MNPNQLSIEVESRLICILEEVQGQTAVSKSYSPGFLSFVDEIKQIREYIEDAGEYSLAFESLICTIEAHPFVLSGKAVIALVELALFFQYKTERPQDTFFDKRPRK